MSSLILFAIGIVFLIAELFTMTFALLWIGIGFLIISLTHMIYPIDNVYAQIAAASGIALVLLLLLRKKMQRWFKGTRDHKDEFLESETGTGIVVQGMIKFKGTLWQYQFQNQAFDLNEGDKVNITAFVGNKVVIDVQE